MRAREPDATGCTTRDGVPLHWDVFGTGTPTVAFLPTWSIVHSRCWKFQVPYFARRNRVLAFDGRGCGRSGRPAGADAYTYEEFAADTVAVLDATGTDRAVLVGLSAGALWGTRVAAEHPDRVLGLVAIGPAVPLVAGHPGRTSVSFEEPLEETRGWAKFNRHYWQRDYEGFLEFFFGRMFTEPHSTKAIEDAVGWGREVDPPTLTDTVRGMGQVDPDEFRELCGKVACPVLVIHGSDDHIRPHAAGAALAEATGGRLVTIDGAGHGPNLRDPVSVNHRIAEFLAGIEPAAVRPAAARWTRGLHRPKRALYLSSPIGLGHAQRDVAIAGELRQHHPDLQIDWLAQHPVRAVLEAVGERVHPASTALASEAAHVDDEACEHDLHAFQTIRRMDEILLHNFHVFDEAVDAEHYDLVIGDEAWDVDYFLHENPERKRFALAWMTDFVGWLPMPEGGDAEAAITADYNAEMIEHRARHRRVRDLSIFVGEPDDLVPDRFGPDLPGIREWTEANFEFAGYVTGFDPATVGDRAALRDELGYAPDERVCVVTVGGSGVGRALLERVADAVEAARLLVDDLRVVVVTGPRIEPGSLRPVAGVTFHQYVPQLYRHLAACDLAVVQGGLTTCMELTASRRPFIYVPLQNHFEQQFHVRHRLERHGAGRCMQYPELADPDALASAIAEEVDRVVEYRPVDPGGAARAAASIAALL